jgi:hypothetical protein
MSRSLSASETASKLLQRLDNPTGGSINEDEIKVMKSLLSHVIHLESSSQASQSLSQPSQFSSKSEPKISQPQYFNGDRKNINEFLTQLKMVFSLQASRFPTEKSKVIYACSYLRNSAFTWAQPMLETLNSPMEESHLNSFQEFSEKLRSAFGDPDPIATAQRELYKLKQGSQSASEYAASFQRFSSRTKWNDDALKYHFTHGLNEDLQDELVTQIFHLIFLVMSQKLLHWITRSVNVVLFVKNIKRIFSPIVIIVSLIRKIKSQIILNLDILTLLIQIILNRFLRRNHRKIPLQFQWRLVRLVPNSLHYPQMKRNEE